MVNLVHTKKIGKNIYIVELETGGIKDLICSYIIDSEKPVLVEAGPTKSIPRLITGIQELKINLRDIEYVALTHVHLDHGGGAGTLLKHLPNAKVLVHPRGVPHLIDPSHLWKSAQKVLGFVSEIFGEPEPVPKDRIIPVTDGTFKLDDNTKLTVFETVGHASHNISFQESLNGGIFPGDAAGTYLSNFDVVVPTTPPPFHLEAALSSLDKLSALNPTVLYFSHFGKATDAVQRLKDYKLQLRLWADIAEEGVKENLSLDEIRDRIIAQDPIMMRVAGYVKSHPIYSKTVLENCVMGFTEYIKQKMSKEQS